LKELSIFWVEPDIIRKTTAPDNTVLVD